MLPHIREYIWLGELIVGVVDGAALYLVENDHLGRPIRMRDAARADVWRAKYRPFSQALITGPATLDPRFPGQWFQLETGLAWNWHRTYDQNLGRYLQPDTLGVGDGPSVYGYVHASPLMGVDREGWARTSTPKKSIPNQTTPDGPGLCLADECDVQYERDIFQCQFMKMRGCYAQESERYAACIAGRPIPPFIY